MSLKQQDPLIPDEEYISYDVESLFTYVPVHETIDYILQEIYVKEKLPKICSKLIMKRFLLKLTTENIFMLNSNFYKQIDGCIMGGPLSVILSDIYMTKTEEEVVKPTNPSFYKIFVDDIISKITIHRNERKFPAHWASKIPKRYKQYAINADVNRAARIASTFTEEIPIIQ